MSGDMKYWIGGRPYGATDGTTGSQKYWQGGLPYADLTGATSTTVVPGTAALTFTARTPAGRVVTILVPGAGALSFTAQTPAVSIMVVTTIVPGNATALAITGYAPTLSVIAVTILVPGAGTLEITGYAPTVPSTTTLTPGNASLALTSQLPDAYVIQYITGDSGISAEDVPSDGTLGLVIVGEFGIDPDIEYVRSAQGWYALGPPVIFGGSDGVVISQADYTLFIGGLDRTRYLRESGARVSKRMFAQASADFRLIDENNIYRPQTWQEVIFYKSGVRKFGGFIVSIEESGTHSGCPEIQLRCLDYTATLDRRVITYDYGTETSLATIVRHIVANFLDGEGIVVGNLDDFTLTGGDIKFSDITVREAFSQLQDASGIYWRLTMEKILHWEAYPYAYAPFIIHKTSANWSNPKVTNDGRQVRTVQGVRTNTLVSGLRDESFAAVDTQNAYHLLYQIAESTAPTVAVNGTAALIVADYQRGWLDHDFWYVPGEAWLYTAKAQLTPGDTVAIRYVPKGSEVVWDADQDAIAMMAARTGGSGIIQSVYEGREVITEDVAAGIAEGMRLAYTGALVTASFETVEDGLEPGHLLPVDSDNPFVKGTLLIDEVSEQETQKRQYKYTVKASMQEPLSIVDASNETPITIRTILPHGLLDLQSVSICGVEGNTAANVINWRVRVVDDDSFELPNVPGNGKYVRNTGVVVIGMPTELADITEVYPGPETVIETNKELPEGEWVGSINGATGNEDINGQMWGFETNPENPYQATITQRNPIPLNTNVESVYGEGLGTDVVVVTFEEHELTTGDRVIIGLDGCSIGGKPFDVTVTSPTSFTLDDTGGYAVAWYTRVVTITPGYAVLQASQTVILTARITHADAGQFFTWNLGDGDPGTLSAVDPEDSTRILYTAPATITNTATATVWAVSNYNLTRSSNVSIQLNPVTGVIVSVSPSKATVPAKGTQAFEATVTGHSNHAVTWSISPATGTIEETDSGALYTAPDTVDAEAFIDVIATSVQDTSRFGTTRVLLSGLIPSPVLGGGVLVGGTSGGATLTPGGGAVPVSVVHGEIDITGITGYGPASEVKVTTDVAHGLVAYQRVNILSAVGWPEIVGIYFVSPLDNQASSFRLQGIFTTGNATSGVLLPGLRSTATYTGGGMVGVNWGLPNSDVEGIDGNEVTTERPHGITYTTPVGVQRPGQPPATGTAVPTGTNTFEMTPPPPPPGSGVGSETTTTPVVTTGRTVPLVGRPGSPSRGGRSREYVTRVIGRTRQRGTRSFDKITFLLANTIPGYASAPITTGVSAGRTTVMFDSTVLAVMAHFRTPPSGTDIILDIKVNGVSIFDANKLVYPADDIIPHRYTNFHTRGLRFMPNDEVTLDVVQVGEDFGGCDGQVVILLSVLRTT